MLDKTDRVTYALINTSPRIRVSFPSTSNYTQNVLCLG